MNRFASLKRTLLAAALLTTAFGPAGAQQAPQRVVELFTSQGCSSCPPADKLMGDLAKEPGTLVLSFPVDYWDYLGWKDTLAAPAFTARQKAYGEARGDRQVYTPQAVIDGIGHCIGSERSAIDSAARTGAQRGALTLAVRIETEGGNARIEIRDGAKPARPATVWLLPVAHSRTVAIGRGENSGASVTYTNVVRGMTRLGEWDGAAVRFEAKAELWAQNGADGFAVIVQQGTEKKPGLILGAAQYAAAN